MSLATLLNIDATRNFLQDGDIYDALIQIAEKYKLPDERVEEFLDLTDAVFDEQITLEEIPGLLQEAFGLNEANARALAVEIVGTRILPLELFFPDVAKQISLWGGDPVKFGTTRIQREGVSIDALAERVATRANLSFSELLIKRLAFLLEQRIHGEKTDESLRTFFGRSLQIGGLGLVKEQIDALMSAISDALPGVQLQTEEDQQQEEAHEQQAPREEGKQEETVQETALEIPPSHDVAGTVPVISSPKQAQSREGAATTPISMKIAEQHEEKPAQKDKKIAEKVKKLHGETLQHAFQASIDIALEKGAAAIQGAHIPQAAWADLTGKMLRGVRDLYQTRDVLERDYKVSTAALPGLMGVLMEAEEAYRLAADALARAHEDVSTDEGDVERYDVDEEKKRDEKFVELTKESVKPQKAIVELTVGSVAPKTEITQKKVADVVAGNRLMGPIEQLKTLTLADFRRLSTNPEEAVRKMEALLLSLQKTNFEDRIQGILAWRKSPLAQLYVGLMAESLNTGVAIAEIAARRRAQGQESLGPAEMQALARWNDKIRF